MGRGRYPHPADPISRHAGRRSAGASAPYARCAMNSTRPGYHVVLESRYKIELDGRFAANKDEIKGAIQALIKDVPLKDGDVIRIVAVQS